MGRRNLASLGIAWYTDDREVVRDLKTVDKMLESIDERGMSISKQDFLGGLVTALTLKRLRTSEGIIGRLADLSSEIYDRMDAQVNLSGPLEASYVQTAKSARQMAASYADSSKMLKKLSGSASLARTLNIDAEGILKARESLVRFNVDVNKMGFKGFKDFIKFVEVYGLDSEAIAKTARGLETWGVSTEKYGDILQKVTAIGRSIGQGAEFVQKLPDIANQLNESFSSMNRKLTPEEIDNYVTSTYKLAAALQATGKTGDEAFTAALGVTQKLLENESSIEKMFSGKEASLPEPLMSAIMGLGDYKSAADAFRAKPLEFIQAMSGAYSQMNEAQQAFFTDQFLKDSGFDADVVNLIRGTDQFAGVTQNLAAADKALLNYKGTLQEVSGAFTDGRTIQERYQKVQEDFEQRLYNIASSHKMQTKFLNLNSKAYKALGDQISTLAQDKGPVGDLTRMFLNHKIAGIQGVAISLADMTKKYVVNSNVLKSVVKTDEASLKKIDSVFLGIASVGPQLVTFLGAMRMAGLGFLGPLGLIVGGLGMIEMTYNGGLKSALKDLSAFVGPKLDEFKDFVITKGASFALDFLFGISEYTAPIADIAEKVSSLFSAVFKSVPWAQVGEAVATKAQSGVEMIRAWLFKTFEVSDWEGLGEKMAGKLSGLSDLFAGWIGKQDAAAAGSATGDMIGKLAKGLTDILSGALDYMTADPAARAAMEKGGAGIVGTMSVALGKSADAFGAALYDFFKAALKSAFERAIGGQDDSLTDKAVALGKTIGAMFVAGFGLSVAGKLPGMGILKPVGAALQAPARLGAKAAVGTAKLAGRATVGTAKMLGTAALMQQGVKLAGSLGEKYGLNQGKTGAALGKAAKVAGYAQYIPGLGALGTVGELAGAAAGTNKAGSLLSYTPLAPLETVAKFVGGKASQLYLKFLEKAFEPTVRLYNAFVKVSTAGKPFISFLGRALKFVLKIAGPLLGIFEYVKEMPNILNEGKKLIMGFMSMTDTEITDSGFKIASSFVKILDGLLMGIPGFIAKKLGIGEWSIKGFYDFLVTETEKMMTIVIHIFKTLPERLTYYFDKVKLSAFDLFSGIATSGLDKMGKLFNFILDGASKIESGFNFIRSGLEKAFANIEFAVEMSMLSVKESLFGVLDKITDDFFIPFIQNLEKMFAVVAQLPGAERILNSAGFDVSKLGSGMLLEKVGLGKDMSASRAERDKKIAEQRLAAATTLTERLNAADTTRALKSEELRGAFMERLNATKKSLGSASASKRASLQGNLSKSSAAIDSLDAGLARQLGETDAAFQQRQLQRMRADGAGVGTGRLVAPPLSAASPEMEETLRMQKDTGEKQLKENQKQTELLQQLVIKAGKEDKRRVTDSPPF
jgi:hypothetical protein